MLAIFLIERSVMKNLLSLKSELSKGGRVKYLFFWGNKPSNTITKSCLSQWWEKHPFESNGIRYLTAEHYMMAGKAKLFNDQEIFEKILDTKHPGEVKKLGRKVKNFNPKIWYDHAFNIVAEGNYYKFSQHEDLRQFILNTGNRVLVEASPYDKIWGIGLKESHPDAGNAFKWKGDNLLGFALMQARQRISGNI